MKIRLLTLLSTIFLLTNVTFGQSVGEYRARNTETITKKIEKPKKPKAIRENNPERRGYYAKIDVNVAYPLPALQGTFGYEFNNHFAFGAGLGFSIPAYYSFGTQFLLDFSGDITNHSVIKNFTLCYSVEPMIIIYDNFEEATFYVLPKIGLRSNNSSFYLTMFGFSFNYKIPLNIGR